ncbi:MAG: hypothetical protein HQL84_10065 [Magnetococcales bacterium]|nr:hypothetical protein [Magnetococcales bacterium]MBF0150376.1 hypothetical protein [Magnetococcales bacterium]MBF0631578.1 hypothetical protein [Magnetococcales bacterium]
MWCRYVYKAAATKANILSDVVKLLTGETSLSNLSSDCDTAASQLITTVAAGWSLHDTAAGTNAKCLKAPLADDAATYKYLVIDTNTTGYLIGKAYETWNATSHTGTNLAYYSDSSSYCQRISTSSAKIYLSASARHVLLFSDMAGTLGSSTGSSPSGLFERSRDLAWDTVAAGYPPSAFINFSLANSAGDIYPPRIKRRSTTDGTGATAISTLSSTFVTHVGAFSETGLITDGQGGEYVPLLPLIMTRWNRGTYAYPGPYGNFSTQCQVWMIPTGVFTVFDEFSAGGNTYIALSNSIGVKYCTRKA